MSCRPADFRDFRRPFAWFAGASRPAGPTPRHRGRAPAAQPTFSKDVAPILYKNCTTCHRPGEIAPMSLLTYEEARPVGARHSRQRRQRHDAAVARGSGARQVAERPPADRRRRRTSSRRWVAAGAPQGDPKDLPRSPTTPRAGQIGQPDAVVSMDKAYEVPATGEIPYQYFEMPTNFTEDKWVQALEIRPGDRVGRASRAGLRALAAA